MSTASPSATRVFVARQPIMDRSGRVFAYELRHREPTFTVTRQLVPDDRATARVLTDGLLAIGFEALTGGRHAFINVSRQFLLDGIPAGLPPSSVILGIGADVEADAAVIEACQALHDAGYGLAIDPFLLATGHAELLHLASYVRVNFADAPTTADRTRVLGGNAPKGLALVATHVETAELFQQAVTEGYQYFQGNFFGRPAVKEGRSVPSHQIAQLRLLRALNNPNLSVHQLAELIKPDPSMCYRVLRAVNSARFALQSTVSSIPEALVLLGRDTIKRWVSLWSLAGLGDNSSQALLAAATLRGRFCELLAERTDRDDAAAEGFLLGLCSMLDAILGQPMSAIVPDLPLPEAMKAALLGDDNLYSRIIRCAIAYEQGEWDEAIELAEAAGVDANALAATYAAALKWSTELERLSEAGSAA
jgi:EAL and modified HD-GYP domain-containing signal transduction protein